MPKIKQEDFIHAIRDGQVTHLKEMLAAEPSWLNQDIDFESNSRMAQFMKNMPPLLFAIRQERYEVMELFLSYPNIDVNHREHTDGLTALHYAARSRHPEFLTRLLEFPLIEVNAANDKGASPLHEAITHHQVSNAKALLGDSRIDVNATDQNGCTPLHMAAFAKHSRLVRLVASHPDCDINLQTANGETALHLAAVYGDAAMVQTLLSHPECEKNLLTQNGQSALDLATSETRELLKEHIVSNEAELFEAISRCDSGMINAILETDPTLINTLNHNYVTPLMLAISSGSDELVELFLSLPDLDISRQGRSGFSALHIACMFQRDDYVEKILRHPKVRVNQRSKDGKTPLHLAAYGKSPDVVKRLLAIERIEVNAMTEGGKRPIDYASAVTRPLIESDSRFQAQKANPSLNRYEGEVATDASGRNLDVDRAIDALKGRKSSGGLPEDDQVMAALDELQEDDGRDLDIHSAVRALKENQSVSDAGFSLDRKKKSKS